jgi:predicted acylesterase/phospholipase RssA
VTVRSLLLLAVAALVAACGQPINTRLDAFDGTSGYRYRNLPSEGNADDLFVILAFSGGGTRAAAFSFGVMEGLNDTKYQGPNGERALLDDVDVISSVSGGSFTAAYYGLFRTEFFKEFPGAFLHRDIEGDLLLRALSPVNWFRLASPTFDRIDMAAELYDEMIFKGGTFADLLNPPRKPFIILNATDMTLGHRFEFTQDQFDLLCSDLGPLKVANGVAASSAFPGLLSPLTLKNFAAEKCGYKEPGWLTDAARQGNPMLTYVPARDARSYQEPKPGRPYIHLLDGGLADNIGLRGPYLALTSNASPWSVLAKINQGRIRRVVVITANAKTKPSHDWDQRRRAPGVFSVLGFVASGPMDNYSFDTVQMVRDFFTQQYADIKSANACSARIKDACGAAGTDERRVVDFFAVELSFDAEDDDALRGCLDNLPTSFALPEKTVGLLRVVARSLLMRSKDFHAAMRTIDPAWTPSPVTIDPALRAEVCASSAPR